MFDHNAGTSTSMPILNASISRRAALCGLGGMAGLVLAGCASTSDTDAAGSGSAPSGSAATAPAANVPTLQAQSDILGMADTGNKTSLKHTLQKTSGPGDINIYYYDEDGNRVTYDDDMVVELEPVAYTGSAVLTIAGAEDDSLIDSSQATVRLVDGNTNYGDEFVLSEAASKLDGAWSNGSYTYTLTTGDIEWEIWDYEINDDSGREWSIMGGDSCGTYFLNMEASGIVYDGQELDPVTFPVTVYIYGRTVTDLTLGTEFVPNEYDETYTSGLAQTSDVQWTWHSDNPDADIPFLNDDYTDYFSITWPTGTDGSAVTADDVTITLASAYGDTYTLQPQNAYGEQEYAVSSAADETQVFVTYQQWALAPVYSTMTIAVTLDGETYEQTYDVASVGAHMSQTGGGGVEADGTVTCYNFHGLSNIAAGALGEATYTLTIAGEDGEVESYYAEKDGIGYLTESPEEAMTFDATDYDECDVRVINNVGFVKTRMGQTAQKDVDGQSVTFDKTYDTMSVSQRAYDLAGLVADGLADLEPGFNTQTLEGGRLYPAWTMRYQSGWTTSTPQPEGLPYVDYPYGYEPGSENPIYAAELEKYEAQQAEGGGMGPGGDGPDGD